MMAMLMTRSKQRDFHVPDAAIRFFRRLATAKSMTRSKQRDFHIPVVAKQFFRILMTRSDDRSTYHLEFRVEYSTLVAWLGDEVEIYYFALAV